MSENVRQALEALGNGDRVSFKRHIDDELNTIASAAIEYVKPVVASNLFGVEEGADLDEFAQSVNAADYHETETDEKYLEPRSPGERKIFKGMLNQMKVQDYPINVEGQFKGSVPQKKHYGYDPSDPGEREVVMQGNSKIPPQILAKYSR